MMILSYQCLPYADLFSAQGKMSSSDFGTLKVALTKFFETKPKFVALVLQDASVDSSLELLQREAQAQGIYFLIYRSTHGKVDLSVVEQDSLLHSIERLDHALQCKATVYRESLALKQKLLAENNILQKQLEQELHNQFYEPHQET